MASLELAVDLSIFFRWSCRYMCFLRCVGNKESCEVCAHQYDRCMNDTSVYRHSHERNHNAHLRISLSQQRTNAPGPTRYERNVEDMGRTHRTCRNDTRRGQHPCRCPHQEKYPGWPDGAHKKIVYRPCLPRPFGQKTRTPTL